MLEPEQEVRFDAPERFTAQNVSSLHNNYAVAPVLLEPLRVGDTRNTFGDVGIQQFRS